MSMVVVVIWGRLCGQGAQRGVERAQERLGLLERGVVAGVLDHVQRPAEAGAGRLGDRQLHLEVVPAPDQGGGNHDPCQVRRRDRRQPQLRHEAAERGLLTGRACPVQGVGRQRLPALAQLLAQPVRVDEALPEEPVPGVLGWLLHEAVQGEPEAGCRLESVQAERVHQHQPRQSVGVGDREAGRDGAAEPMPHQCGWRRAGVLDQRAEPRDHMVGVQLAVSHL